MSEEGSLDAVPSYLAIVSQPRMRQSSVKLRKLMLVAYLWSCLLVWGNALIWTRGRPIWGSQVSLPLCWDTVGRAGHAVIPN